MPQAHDDDPIGRVVADAPPRHQQLGSATPRGGWTDIVTACGVGSAPAEGMVLDGVSAADGFAVGRAMRLARSEPSPSSPGAAMALHDAIVRVRQDLHQVLTLLAPDEAELFEPEVQILEEIAPRLIAREADGESREEAIFAETDCGCTDLVIDLRERLLGAVRGSSEADVRAPAMHHESDLVLLTKLVTPSTVAFLPKQVAAIVAPLEDPTSQRRDAGRNSHAAILARGRGVPVVYLTPEQWSSNPWGRMARRRCRRGGRADPGRPERESPRGRATYAGGGRARTRARRARVARSPGARPARQRGVRPRRDPGRGRGRRARPDGDDVLGEPGRAQGERISSRRFCASRPRRAGRPWS